MGDALYALHWLIPGFNDDLSNGGEGMSQEWLRRVRLLQETGFSL